MNITMLGLGKLGLPVAECMATAHTVKGYDISTDIKSDVITICHSLWNACQDADIIFIAVPTPHDPEYGGETPTTHLPNKDFNYTALLSVLQNIVEHAPATALIVNISTVLPGTLRDMIHKLNLQDRFCYNPYLIAMGTVADDFRNPDIMMLGFDSWPTDQHESQANTLKTFYATMHQSTPHITCGTWEEAECIKIFHNTYLSAKVSIANMIQDVTQRIGHANPSTIAESLRHADRVVGHRYMEPGMGDGGPCHPRDNIALSWLADKLNLGYDLFADVMRIRERQAELLSDELIAHGLPITIMGRAFKPGVKLTDGSPSLLVAHYCAVKGHTVQFDHIDRSEARTYLLAHPSTPDEAQFVSGSVIVDMHRTYHGDRADITIKWYGVRDEDPVSHNARHHPKTNDA